VPPPFLFLRTISILKDASPDYAGPDDLLSAMSKIKFVLSLITRENDYQREQAKAAEAVAGRLNVDLEILYADSDSVTQSSQLLDVIHKHKSELSGILVEPAGGTSFPQVGRAAVSAGIAWVVLNRDANSVVDLRGKFPAPAFAVSSDHVEVGRIQAQQLAAILPEGGTVLCIQGPSASLAAQQRMVGLQEAKPSNITLKLLKSSNWTEEGGHHAVSSWLRLMTSHQQQIHAVAAQNDFIALGARKAFEEIASGQEAAHWAKLPFLGVDGLARTGQSWVNGGSLTATVVVPAVAGSALEMAVEAIAKKAQPPDIRLIPAHSFPGLDSLRSVSVQRR
jgi:ribose transport system substrate-binding protein